MHEPARAVPPMHSSQQQAGVHQDLQPLLDHLEAAHAGYEIQDSDKELVPSVAEAAVVIGSAAYASRVKALKQQLLRGSEQYSALKKRVFDI